MKLFLPLDKFNIVIRPVIWEHILYLLIVHKGVMHEHSQADCQQGAERQEQFSVLDQGRNLLGSHNDPRQDDQVQNQETVDHFLNRKRTNEHFFYFAGSH